jgi:F0F1-type ATP synthase assembly protein I
MNSDKKNDDKSSWAIGGTTLMGIGVGLIFLKTSPLVFVACILIGIGLGLVVAPMISSKKG